MPGVPTLHKEFLQITLTSRLQIESKVGDDYEKSWRDCAGKARPNKDYAAALIQYLVGLACRREDADQLPITNGIIWNTVVQPRDPHERFRQMFAKAFLAHKDCSGIAIDEELAKTLQLAAQ